MAKVNIEVDTESKAISVSVNGMSIENVQSVSIYKPYYDDEKMVHITTKKESEGDVETTQFICAKDLSDSIGKLIK